MRLTRPLSCCLLAALIALFAQPCSAQTGDSTTVLYTTRYTQLYRSYVDKPTHIPTLIALSDFYADSLNPMFNRPLAMYYIRQAELLFSETLLNNKKIREANRLIKQGININFIREKKNKIALGTMAYLQTDPPLSRSEIDHYVKYFKHEPAVKQQLSQMKVTSAYRDATISRQTNKYHTFIGDYGGTAEADSAEAALAKQANRLFDLATTTAQIDSIAQRYPKSTAIQRAAAKRKGHIAYRDARNRHTVKAYHDFLLHNPMADEYGDALNMLDTIALEQLYLLHTAQDYVDFIRNHEANPIAEKALQQLRQRIEQHHDAGAAELYLKNFPMDADHTRLYQLYYSWHACEGNRSPIADFADRHRDYPFIETVRNDRANGVRIDAFDLTHASENDCASFIRMNMGKRITFVALQRMMQANLDAKRWKAALKTMQDFSICFESDGLTEYQQLEKLLETANNATVARENGYKRISGPIAFADGDSGLKPFCLYENGAKMLVGRNGDIWTAHTDGVAWHLDAALPEGINTQHTETDAYMLPDGSGMIFASDRPGGCNIQRSKVNYHGDTALAADLYYVALSAGQWGEPIHLDNTVNTPYCERYPAMSRNGKTLYFVSDGRGGMGYGDIYRTTRLDDSWQRWSEPENLGREVNSAHREGGLALSADEKRLYFSSDRGNTLSYYSVAISHNPQRTSKTTDDNWSLDNIVFLSNEDGEYITHPGDLPLLVNHLTAHPEVDIDIVSYHQGIDSEQCYRISLQRGEAVRRYLTSHGIDHRRIRVSAYGNLANGHSSALSARHTTTEKQ